MHLYMYACRGQKTTSTVTLGILLTSFETGSLIGLELYAQLD